MIELGVLKTTGSRDDHGGQVQSLHFVHVATEVSGKGLPWLNSKLIEDPRVNARSLDHLLKLEKDHPFCLSWPQFLHLENEGNGRAVLSLLKSSSSSI